MSARRLGSVGITVAGTISIAVACFLVRAPAVIAAPVLLSTVLLAGTYGKLAEAVTASVVATLSLDYFFIPPIRAIEIADPQGWIILLVFLAVSLFATNLSNRLHHQRDELIRRHSETEKLYALSRALLLSDRENIRRLVINKSIELFGFSEVALYESATGAVQRSQSGSEISDDQLKHVAVSGSVITQQLSDTVIVPIILGNKTFGSLGTSGAFMPEGARQALVNTVAVGLARAEAQEASSRAEAVRQGEELKSVMIDALAHDLKTPLTVIEAASDLLVSAAPVTMEQQQDLLHAVREQSRGLKRLLDEAIHLARIDATKLKLEPEPTSVRELLDRAIQSLGDQAGSRVIALEIEPDIPAALVDRDLMVPAIKQVLDNALKYSPPNLPVTVSAFQADGIVSISVRDHGPGLTEVEQARIFDKFYRGQRDHSGVQGTGMGLAIAREIIAAHGGSISVESKVGEGSRFTIRLNSTKEPVLAQA